MTAPKSPTQLRTYRNIAIEKGTVPGGFVQPDLSGVQFPVQRDDAEVNPTAGGQSPGGPSPFNSLRGGR